jgi:large subunit ribosomal protein L23
MKQRSTPLKHHLMDAKNIVLPPLKSNKSSGASKQNVSPNSMTPLRGIREDQVVGTRVYLPNIIFRMVRNNTKPGEPYNPYQATFRVPLSLTKYDIKAYLLAVYGVKTTFIRTDIRRGAPLSPSQRATDKMVGHHRQEKITYKRAVVGLVEPFYFPQAIEDMHVEDKRQLEVEHFRRGGLSQQEDQKLLANHQARFRQQLRWNSPPTGTLPKLPRTTEEIAQESARRRQTLTVIEERRKAREHRDKELVICNSNTT